MTLPMTVNQTITENYVIIASLKSETMGKLIKLMGKALITHFESLDKPRNVNKSSQSLAIAW